MVIFQQNFGANENVIVEYLNVCKQHLGCVGCPGTKGKVMQIGESQVVCETGRDKNE